MAKASGATRTKTGDNGGSFHGSIKNVESLKNIKDKQLYNAMKSAISRYHTIMGVRQKNVKLADIGGAYGVHVTSSDGKSEGVYLSKKYFKNKTVAAVANEHAKNYKNGWSTKTNKPVAHTLTHELAHATWNSYLSSPNAKAATKEVTKLYDEWSKDKKKTGYGKYARTNVNEFWAETSTKAVHGKADRYTKAVKDIIKRYKL